MNILYIGDVMGEAGIEVVEKTLPDLRREKKLGLIVAQAENVTSGKGITLADFNRLKRVGVNFFTGGNHILDNDEIFSSLSDPAQPVIRPANYPEGVPGLGYKYVEAGGGKILIISLLGQIVGKDAEKEMNNPLKVIDGILEREKATEKVATIVNFHGDYSSEKVVIGHYLDGRVTAVIGDHWHVPTNDARVLPGGTAHITDVGMCGALDSSLGVTYDSIIPRWRDSEITKNQLETAGPRQFNGLIINCDETTGLATGAQQVRKLFAS